MRITNLQIQNFRGIKEGTISFPQDSRFVCIIGPGDSTKSTILKAIEWVSWPSWNLLASDNDFYNGNTDKPIVIQGTFTEIPDSLLGEDKFGLYLRKSNCKYGEGIDDEPEDDDICLTIQLTISESLEPKWEVICNREEPKLISQSDRKLMFVENIGDNYSKDLVWGKNSVLQRYEEAKGVLHNAYTEALREVANNTDLHELDEVNGKLVSIGKKYGVGFNSELKNKLIIQNGSFSTSVGIYDGGAPLNQRGRGSQRLLSMGLNISASDGNALLLIDEIENGLEPYRLRSLINEFRTSHSTCGQVIVTTHSPIAVAECKLPEILLVHSADGHTESYVLYGDDSETNNAIQKELRRNPEAFLSPKIIICEGKTEIGFVRAIDNYLSEKYHFRMAFSGIGTADGGGSTIFKCTEKFLECGYHVCLLMDSDLPEEEIEKNDLRERGIQIFDWDQGFSIEEQMFKDANTDICNKLISIAISNKGFDHVRSLLSSSDIKFEIMGSQIIFNELSETDRVKIGTIAKSPRHEWFKRIEFGEQAGNVIFNNLNSISQSSKLFNTILSMKKWITNND